jgi:hypothetical protein
MTARGKEHNRVVIAIARELVGFLWATLAVEYGRDVKPLRGPAAGSPNVPENGTDAVESLAAFRCDRRVRVWLRARSAREGRRSEP